jgi:hypothetical protein
MLDANPEELLQGPPELEAPQSPFLPVSPEQPVDI